MLKRGQYRATKATRKSYAMMSASFCCPVINGFPVARILIRVLKIAFSDLQNRLHDFIVGAPFVRGDHSCVPVDRDPGVSVKKDFLDGLEVNFCRSQVRRQRVTGTVPADHLVGDSVSNKGRPDDFLERSATLPNSTGTKDRAYQHNSDCPRTETKKASKAPVFAR